MEKREFLMLCRILLFSPFAFLGLNIALQGVDGFFPFLETNLGKSLLVIGFALYLSAYHLIKRMKRSTLSFKALHALLLLPSLFIFIVTFLFLVISPLMYRLILV